MSNRILSETEMPDEEVKMEIRIYQINMDRDVDGRKFMGTDRLKQHFGDSEIDSEIYDRVYEGEVSANSLEDVYRIFNLERPADFTGHSLSVSDVVEIVGSDLEEPGFYFCDSIGFQKVAFDTTRVPLKEESITVVFLEPGKLSRIEQIDSSLRGLQQAVDGWIEAVYPFEEQVCIVCNEEGKLRSMPLNRAIRCEGQITDIIAGPCFICSCDKANFGSLTEEQQRKYMKMFKYPEHFLKINGEIAAIPYTPKKGKDSR